MPFVLMAPCRSLPYLREYGFKTFDGIFDESYDDVLDWKQRVQRIVQQVQEFDQRSVNQPSVLEKLQHNQSRLLGPRNM